MTILQTQEGFDSDSFNNLLEKLKTLPAKVEKNIISAAIRSAASNLQKEIKSKTPLGETGILRKGIKVRPKRAQKGEIHINVASITYYARFVEQGRSITKKGQTKRKKDRIKVGHVEGKPFFEPAYRGFKPKLILFFEQKIREKLGKLAQK